MNNWKYRENLPVTGVDQDDTFFPFREVFVSKINDYFGTDFDASKLGWIQNDTYLNKQVQEKLGITDDDIADFQYTYNSKNFYMGIPPFKGAVEGLKVLNDETNLFLLTSPIYPDMMHHVDQVLKFKAEYFREYLPFIDPTQYAMMHVKSLFNADIIVDDSYSQLIGNAVLKYLMTASSNKGCTSEDLAKIDAIRVLDWDDLMLHYDENKDKVKVRR